MQVNPTSTSLQTGSMTPDTKGTLPEQSSGVEGHPFATLFSSAEKHPVRLTEIGDNVYRFNTTVSNDEFNDTSISDQKDETTLTETASALPASPPLSFTQIPTININLNSQITKIPTSSSSVMIQVISHIRSLATTYHTVQFDIPEERVSIKITGVGPTLKIAIATDDASLRQDLKTNQGDLTHLLRRELASPTLELTLDPPPQGQGQNSQNHNSNHQETDPNSEDDNEL